MHVVNNSPRALIIALVPLAMIHAVLTAMALLGTQATQPGEVPTPDNVLFYYLARLVIDGALLYTGHRLLRQFVISSRLAYSVMGGVTAAIGYAIAIRNNFQLDAAGNGTLLTVGLLPAIAGSIAGFLYRQYSGLTVAAEFPSLSYEGLVTSLAFDGPVRVRTSVAGIAIASAMPAVLMTILSVTLASLLPGFAGYMSSGTNPVIAIALPAHLFLTSLIVTVVPSAILVLCLHHIARALGRDRAWEYGSIGAAIALVCAYLVSPMVPMLPSFALMTFAAFCGAIMGSLYRSFAGLEPVPLPEAVIATDLHALVAADDPARRQHKVILGN